MAHMATILERLMKNLDRSGEHWIFLGCKDANGYGLVWDSRRGNNSRTHRLAYEFWVGPIPEGHDIHHECQVRACCNPGHLVALPRLDHLKEHGSSRRKTHCLQGHEFSGLWRRGQQVCRICLNESVRKYRVANRDVINERKRDRRRAAKVASCNS